MRTRMLLLVVLLVPLGVAGCETLKGGSEGFARDVENTAENVPDLWASLQKADAWIKEHLW